jgi:hypothetical protein
VASLMNRRAAASRFEQPCAISPRMSSSRWLNGSLPEPARRHHPVLAVQGGGYVVAGLAMLVRLEEEPGELETSSAGAQGEPALVPAEG